MSAFSIPLSGLEATSQSLNVIANNLANLNTDGYKDETLNFGDIFNQMQGTSGNGDPIQTGSGVQVAGTSSNFNNGSVSTTNVSSNMALQGNGFFVVQNGTQTDYTRSGDFTVNSQGQLTTTNGELVMGYPAVNGVVSTSEALAPISVDQASTVPAVASTTFQMNTNLDSSGGVGATFSTPITVYDSLGTAQTLSVQYTNTAANKWSYSITIPAAATGGTGSPTTVASGNLTFDSSGNLTSPTGTVTGIKITGLADGAADMNLTWNLNNASGTPSITQQDSASATSTTTQNGYGVGTLTSYSVLPDGTVQGQFSNSQTLALGQVAVASFANAQGLAQSGQSDYQATFASGTAVVGQAGSGGNGTITGGAVEGSNVDLSTEFANMIVAQQGYEANAKALTTLDQISQATIQMMTT
ncbi:MAG: flagellar hook protein FlgE [Acidobacteriaceae bacterium]